MIPLLASPPLPAALPAASSTQPTSLLDQMPQLEPDISPLPYMDSTPWMLYSSLALVIVALLIAGILLYRRLRKPPVIETESAEQRAHASLHALGDYIEQLNLTDVSIRLSLILREFITGETEDPALYETHQELNQRLDALASIPPRCQEEPHRLLERLAQLKYTGPQRSFGDEPRLLLEQTSSLIQRVSKEQARLAELKRQEATR